MIAEMEIKGFDPATGSISLDPKRNSPRAQEFAEGLRTPIVGQERAVRQVSGLYQTFLAGTNPINRPIGTMLFLDPTDYGKTRVVETAAEVVIVRSFANCPRPHHFSTLSSLYFQQLTNGSVIALSSVRDLSRKRGQMLRIERAANREGVLTVSGRMDAENLIELKNLIDSEAAGRRIVLDLKDLTLVDRDAVRFLEQCDSNGIRLRNCPPYIREWIARERDGR
jgi:hypothetical protein